MNLEGRGVLKVVYQDGILTAGRPKIIHVPHGKLDSVAEDLDERHHLNCIGYFGSGTRTGHYLVNGVMIVTEKVASAGSGIKVDQLSLYGETRTGLELIARDLKLPEIPERSFVVPGSRA